MVTLQTGNFSKVTNESAVKAFADVRLWGWSTLRTSVRFGERRLDGDYINPLTNSNAFRMVNIQNRDSTIVKSSWAIDVTRSITFIRPAATSSMIIRPMAGLRPASPDTSHGMQAPT